jgi:hypothetical protein
LILVAPLAAVGTAEACLAALPACLCAAGDGAVGFYGYGSLAGTAGGLSTVASMQAAGDLSSDAMELMLGRCRFSPDTRVLLANGREKAIRDVDIGDVVVATDPGEGRTAVGSVLTRNARGIGGANHLEIAFFHDAGTLGKVDFYIKWATPAQSFIVEE